MMAYMTGRIKAKGDIISSQKLQNVFDQAKMTELVKNGA
jgi:putative sterol carrier protein